MDWDLKPGDVIKRTILHDRFGGGRQGGIAGSATTPNVLIFTSPGSGLEHGYVDGWQDDGTFYYTGEGQRGDQEFLRGNRAIRDHATDGKSLRLFEGTGGMVTYQGKFELDKPPYHIDESPETGDGPLREVIVFHMKPVDEDVISDVKAPSVEPAPFATVANEWSAALRASGRDYGKRHDLLTKSFLASLASKRFLILTGLSGSGKTQLALGLGQWLGKEQMLVVPVRPDWTSPEALLGFENALSAPDEINRYAWNAPDTLKFILRAHRHESVPHLLVLDEMNLAHVERYFADLLSGMESDEPVLPYLEQGDDGLWRQNEMQPLVPVPPNLFVVGTVNVDETTYMFSPKVLDRANTIEFRVETDDLRASAGSLRPVEVGSPESVAGFWEAAKTSSDPQGDVEFVAAIKAVHALMALRGREFGHRTFFEARVFAQRLAATGEQDMLVALDLAVLQKVLPKLHGSRSELTELLNGLGQWCFRGPGSEPNEEFDATTPPANSAAVLEDSFDKIHRMAKRLRDNHFVSFAE